MHTLDALQKESTVTRRRFVAFIGWGSFAAFWGSLVLATLRPELDVTLIESDARKAAYLGEALAGTVATNLRAIHGFKVLSRASTVDFARRRADGSAIKDRLGALNVAVAPLGSPVTVRPTAPLKPPVGVTVAVYVVLPPAVTDWLAGVAAMEKSPVCAGVRVTSSYLVTVGSVG